MNGFCFGIIFALLFVNFLYYPLVAAVDGAIHFVCREPYEGKGEQWQDWKWQRFACTKNWDNDLFAQVLRWAFVDGVGASVLLFFCAYLGSIGILWVPAFVAAALFGARAYVDRYGKEWKVKL